MKKLITLFMAIIMVFCFVGCGTTETVTNDGAVASKTEVMSDNRLGNYEVTIDACRLATDYSGNPIAIVTFTFTNHDDDSASFYTSITAKAFQGAVETETCYFVGDGVEMLDNDTKDIRSGGTIQVEKAYALNDTTTPLELEVTEWISFSNKKITKTFELN